MLQSIVRRDPVSGTAGVAMSCIMMLQVFQEAMAAGANAAGANATNTTGAAAHGGAHQSHPHVAVLFMFMALALGVATTFFLQRFFKWMPYTVMLMLEGIALGCLQGYTGDASNFPLSANLGVSMQMWEGIDPHLLLAAFLPALLFGDAMAMDTHLEMKCLRQTLLLACPGVMLGTFLTAAFAKFCLPYDWSWEYALTFGSILAATDPVAVVSLLKSVGASPKLTMLISGESLLNDGTAIVLFVLFKDWALSKLPFAQFKTQGEVALFALRMAGLGPLIGIACGAVLLYFLATVRRVDGGEGPTKQVVLTLVGAYLTFFIAEFEAGSSGVLATVFAAQVIAALGWPFLLDHENIEVVWKTVEFVGNTVIFLLAGAVFGELVWSNTCPSATPGVGCIATADYGWLVLLYVTLNVMRMAMLLLFAPLLMRWGYGVTWAELFVMGWGGLRGAVGLALALAMRGTHGVDELTGVRFVFHVGGVAVLTLLINGCTMKPLLASLGLTRPSTTEKQLFHAMELSLADLVAKEYERRSEDHACGRHSKTSVEELVTALRRANEIQEASQKRGPAALAKFKPPTMKEVREGGGRQLGTFDVSDDPESHDQTLADVRRVFLGTVRKGYWEQIEDGVLPARSPATLELMHSVDIALDNVNMGNHPLSDWQAILDDGERIERKLARFVRIFESLKWVPLLSRALRSLLTMIARLHEREYYQASCYGEWIASASCVPDLSLRRSALTPPRPPHFARACSSVFDQTISARARARTARAGLVFQGP